MTKDSWLVDGTKSCLLQNSLKQMTEKVYCGVVVVLCGFLSCQVLSEFQHIAVCVNFRICSVRPIRIHPHEFSKKAFTKVKKNIYPEFYMRIGNVVPTNHSHSHLKNATSCQLG